MKQNVLALTLVVLCAIILGVGSARPSAHAQAAHPAPQAAHHSMVVPTIKRIPNCTADNDGDCQQTCYQDPEDFNCDGLDPITSGCTAHGTTSTLEDSYIIVASTILHVEMRYNSACQSRWTRVTPMQPGNYSVSGKICQLVSPYKCDYYHTVTNSSLPLYTNIEFSPYPDSSAVAMSYGDIVYGGTLYKDGFGY